MRQRCVRGSAGATVSRSLAQLSHAARPPVTRTHSYAWSHAVQLQFAIKRCPAPSALTRKPLGCDVDAKSEMDA